MKPSQTLLKTGVAMFNPGTIADTLCGQNSPTTKTNIHNNDPATVGSFSFIPVTPSLSKGEPVFSTTTTSVMKKGLRNYRLLAIAFTIISMFFVNAAFSQATVTTDKPDYTPLSTAIFTGSGFQAFEDVVLKVKNLTQPCHTNQGDSSYTPWTVTADENGEFSTIWAVCNCPGDSLRLKATGQSSALIAYAYFTDADVTGDYRSVASGNWSLLSTWERYNGTTWVTPTAGQGYPGQNASPAAVTFQSTFTVTLDVSPANSITSLIVNSNGALSLTSGTNDITLTSTTGSVTVNNGGSVFFNSGSNINGGANGSAGVAVTINSGANLTTANTGGFVAGSNNTLLGGSFAVNRGNTGANGPNYSTGANYTYNGSAAQVTGNGLIGANNLTINNAAGVTLSIGTTIGNGGSLNLVSGLFVAASNLSMTSTSTINRSAGSMSGNPQGAGVYNVSYTGSSKTTTTELAGSGLNNITVGLTGGQTLTLDQNRTPDGDLSVSTGIFDLGNLTINRSAAGGTLTLSNGATLKIGGTNGFPANYTGHSLGTTSTVEYAGTTQTVSGESYGNITLSGTLAKTFSSGNTTVSNILDVSGGTMTPNGGKVIFTGTSGSMTGTGAKNFFNLQFDPGAVISNSGTGNITVGGNYTNNGTSFTQLSANTITFNAASGTQTLTGSGISTFGSYAQSGAKTVDASAHSFSVSGSSFDATNASGIFKGDAGSATIIFSGSTTFGSGTGAITFNNVTISGILLNNTNNKNFNVKGNWTNNGTYTTGTETIKFNGGATQTIGGTISTTFKNLEIANTSGGVILGNAETVSGTLTLTSGILTTDATNILSVTNTSGSAVSAGSSSKFIKGPLNWALGVGTYLFPVGKSTSNYFPFTLTNSAAASPVVTVEAFDGDVGVVAVDATLYSISHSEYWKATLNSGTLTGKVSLTRINALTTEDVIGKSTAQGGTYTSIGGTAASPSINSSNDISSFSFFVMATSTKDCPVSTEVTPDDDQTVCRGVGTNQLTADITTSGGTGNPIFQYQWYYNLSNTSVISGSTVTIGGATSNTYTPLSGASEAGTTRYYFCVGYATNNSCGQSATTPSLASNTVKVTVNAVPQATFAATTNITIECNDAPPIGTSLSYSNSDVNCPISGSATGVITGSHTLCGGTYTENWSFTDAFSRTSTQTRTITVNPAALPTMTAPGNITVACGGVPAPSTLSFTNGLSGGCLISGTSDASTFTATPDACGGTVTETWTATDMCGRALASVSRVITVSPAALPTMTAPGNITVACGGVPAPSTISFTNSLSGGCLISGTSDASTFTATPDACGGTVTETWTATDMCGRPLASVSRVITVSPAALPTMTAPGNITVACGGIPAPSTISFTNGLSGGCLISGTSDASTFTATPDACGGTVTETWTATDECERPLASVSRVITVSPAALPTMTAPGNITVACGGIPAASTISFTNGLSGGCLISGTSDPSTFTTTPDACGGTVTETWTATDECGRALGSVSRVITVSPAALPTMTAPGNITVACGGVPDPSTLPFSNGLSGGCLISGTSDASTFTATPDACGGTVTETWTATDMCGRALASVSRVITVSPAALPTMTAPGNITVACGGVPAATTLPFSNGLSGGCLISGISDPSTFTATPDACGGTVTETWTATDMCGRTLASISRVITVNPAALPTMTAPGNITVACGGVPAPSTLSFTNGLSGGCLISGTSDASTFTATPGACGGTVTETWTATDICGRPLASVSRVITVSPAALPTMTAPGNITVVCGGVPAPSTISFTNGLNGGCLISGTSDASTFTATPGACGGPVTETWTATDMCGRALASVSRVITVSPAALPTMTAPGNITVACGGVPAASTLSFSNGLSAGCLISGTSNPSTFTATPDACGGTVTETWTATDMCGRALASVSRVITVSPAALPTMTAPGNITVACGGVPAPSTISFTNGLSGGCLISGTSDASTFTATPDACGGTVTETWTATDICGRALASVSRVITVSPAALPTMTAPGNITVACGGVPAPSTLSFTNGLSGGCLISGTSDASTFTATPDACGGTVTETWTATDICGRALASVSRVITVSPAALPTMTAPGNITVACGGVPAPSTISFTNGLSGGCLISGTSDASTFTATPDACGGTVTETWTATDICGRVLASVSRVITVSPAALPTMTAPGDITVACGGVPAPSTLSFTNGLSGGCLVSGTSDASTFTATPDACGGTVTETWTATDICGRALASVSRVITVSPAALPTMTAPGNITVACGGVPAPSTLSFTNGLSGGCLISGTSDPSTFTATPDACGGTVTETWTATDICGRALASVSRVITVSPAALPTMTAPGNITVACGGVPAPSTISFTNGLSGGCLISGTSDPSIFTATPDACGGTVTETWTATDICGRALASVSRVITVSPAALPTMTAPGNITVACGGVPAPSTISFTNGLSGGCLVSGTSDASTFTATPDACGGTVTETWTATDICGRALASVSRVITVSPAALPTMTAPGNITVACGGVPAPSTISFTNGLSGGCLISGTSDPSTFTATPDACGGTVTETWTATDVCGRPLASVSRVITVSPAALPTMTAPGNITVACGGVPAPSTISFTNGLSGGCLISGTSDASTFTATPGACGGTVTETWTATDPCGRSLASVSRVITVSPAALPTMTAPGNITVACGGVPAPSTLSFTNGLSGGCLISGTSNPSTFTATPGACGGPVTETWTATDMCGRTLASVSRVITVSPAALPTMTAPGNITVACGGVPAASTLPFSNGLSAGCLISGTSNLSTFTAIPGACGGTVTETWTATDICGRALASVSRVITVSPAALPVMTAPGNITVACGGVPAPSTLSFTNGLSGGCLVSGTSDPSTFTATPDACGGTVTETWTATDICGRALASVSRVITVSPAALPTMTAPGNITVACGGVPATSTLPFSNGLSAGCLISGTSNLSTFTTIPGACGGTVTETWTATDICGRALASVSRVITVSPAALPTMTAPGNITVACGGVPAPSTLSFTNGLSGGCLISGTSNPSTFTATPGACGGTVTETWTATDPCGRSLASVSRVITVSPAALPTMTAPGNITVACGGVPAASTLPFSNGLSAGCLISGTSNSSTFTTIPGACGGTVTETWTATDICGRALASVSRVITVSPAALPTMTAPGNITVACGGVPAATTLPFSNGLAAGCLISGTSNLSTFTATPGACGGTVTETWTATDMCGRALASVFRVITVSPAALPTMTAPGNITVACGGVPAASTLPYSNGLSAGCLISGTSNLSTFTATPGKCGGTVTETWTATDPCGRVLASVSRVITVNPTTQAQFGAVSNLTISTIAAPPVGTSLAYTNGQSGSCQISGSVIGVITGSHTECGGSYTETWTYVDECNRTSMQSRTITVVDMTNPVITCPVAVNAIRSTNAGVCTYTVSGNEFNATATDNCAVTSLTYSLSGANGGTGTSLTGVILQKGITTVLWTAKDAVNNTVSCSFTITINDTENPVITCPVAVNATRSTNTGICTYTVSGNEFNATATDNCAVTSLGYALSGANIGTGTNLTGIILQKGVTTVLWTAKDAANNTVTCSFTITINDTENPYISCKPNAVRNSNAGVCTYTAYGSEFNVLSVSDNCGYTLSYALSGATTTVGYITASTLSGVAFNKGVTTVTWKASDAAGNYATCSFTVTVNDTQNPTITCSSPYSAVFNPVVCGVSYAVPNTVISDNCVTVTQTWTITRNSIVEASGNGNVGTYIFKIGTSTIAYLVTDGSGNTNTCSTSVTVTALSVTPDFTVTPASQQYSDIVEFKVVIPNGVSTCGNAAVSATFTVTNGGSQIMGTANFVPNGANLEAILNAPLFEIPNSSVLAPGPKTASVVLNGANNSTYQVGAPGTKPLTITQEDARINFTGTQLVATLNASSGLATVTLRATVQDITATPDAAGDVDFGDIRKAKVRFLNSNVPIVISGVTDVDGWVLSPIVLVNPADIKTGIVTAEWPVNIGSASDVEYTIGMEVSGYYTRNSTTDNTVITVYKPVGDFITGGGHIIPINSAGVYASDPGKKTNFGFNVKYNKSGKNLQGNMNVIFRRTVSGIVRVYQIKTNSMTSLGVDISDPNAMTAVFVSKCNLTDITNPSSPQSLGGGLNLQVNMTDRGEPGNNDDIAITLYNGNTLWYSSNWVGNNTGLMYLAGGNLVVHSGFNVNPPASMPVSKGELVEKSLPGEEDGTSVVLTVKVIGNPTESSFILIPQSNGRDLISMRMTDISGTVVERRDKIVPGELIRVGGNYIAGTYLVEFTQGNQRRIVKLIKL